MEIDQILAKIIDCEEKEHKIRDYRKKLEAKLLEKFPVQKDGGSKTTNVLDYKVKTEVKVYRKVDMDKLPKVITQLSEIGKSCFVTKYEVSAKNLNSIKLLDPKEAELVESVIHTTLSAPSVKVERKGD
jgi:N-acetylmuramoyl-L-alanine amidase CwlA